MHPRNRYKAHPLDIEGLASKSPSLRSVLLRSGNGVFDPLQPDAVEALVTAMIQEDLGVKSYEGVPKGHLIPSVTRSLNYIHFVEDLLAESQAKGLSSDALRQGLVDVTIPPHGRAIMEAATATWDESRDLRKRPRIRLEENLSKSHLVANEKAVHDHCESQLALVRGIDLGTGCSAIFPIVGCSLHPDWSFVGVDVQADVLDCARRNTSQFASRVDFRLAPKGSTPVLDGALDWKRDKFDFLMCNPPFFSGPLEYSVDPDVDVPAANGDLAYNSAFGGTDLERWCEGGEAHFVSGLVDLSTKAKFSCIWFTSMLGKKENLRTILAKIHSDARSVESIRVYRLDQGHRARWVVAWSFFPHVAVRPIYGRVMTIDLSHSETIHDRIQGVFKELRNFTPETGICGKDGWRFRLRVTPVGFDALRVDALDLKGEEGVVDAKALSVLKKVEQLLERRSRRWHKGHSREM